MISNSTVQSQGRNDLFNIERGTDGGLALLNCIPCNKNLFEVQIYTKTTVKEVISFFNNLYFLITRIVAFQRLKEGENL